MLTKIIKVSLLRRFCTINQSNVQGAAGSSNDSSSTNTTEVTQGRSSLLPSVTKQLEIERKHFQLYISEIKHQLSKSSSINFQLQENNQKLVLQTISADGSNNWRFAEIITGASLYHLLTLIAGYPSYLALGGTLGLAALGASLSYSNYLRRSNPQITHIYEGAGNKLHVHFLKSSGLTKLFSSQQEIVVDGKSINEVSFGSPLLNLLRKNNNTRWVRIDGQLYWFNGNPNHLRVNNFSKLI